MCKILLIQFQSQIVLGAKFDEDYKLDFKGVEIEEITVYTPENYGNLQVVWYDFYIPLFSVLVDGEGNIVDH